MRIIYLRNAGFLLSVTAMLVGLRSEAQEGRTSGAATRPRSEAEPGQRARRVPFPAGILPSAEILSAQFQATVYEVQAAAERLGSLDDKMLARQAGTPETLLAALAQTGKTRLLYRIEQPVNVFSTRIIIGSSEPVISGTRNTTTGGTVNSINYQNVGFIVQLSAQGPTKDQDTAAPIVTSAIKLSVVRPGQKEIAPGQQESVIRAMSLDHSGALEMNRPQVLLAISSNAFSSFRRSADANKAGETPTTPVAYVVRYQFSPSAQGSASGAVVASNAAAPPTATSETAPPTNTLTAQFQAAVYEVEVATNRLPTLDLKTLQSAPTPELLLSALNGAGKPRGPYSINQPVNVFSDQVMLMTNKPIVTATRAGSDGEPVNSYTYHNMGVIVRLSARPPPKEAKRDGPDVTISFNVSADAPGNTDIGLGQMAEGFPMISQEHAEPLEWGRPRVILAMGSSAAAEQAKPFVYVIRYQFGPPDTK
jgi:hypothetical protein